MGDLSKPTPARPDLEVRLAALRGYKMTWQETLAQKRSFIRGETGATDDDLRVTMPELFADVEVAERDAEIARLTAENDRLRQRLAMPDHELGYECEILWGGKLAADAEIARLRAMIQKLDRRIHRQRERLAWFERWADQGYGLDHRLRRLWQELASKRGREADRLRAGITAAVEGRYERVPHEHDAAFCRHNLQKKAACLCGSCLRAHLLALLGEPGPEDRT